MIVAVIRLKCSLDAMQYPFLPKSTSKLAPGHFWDIPLANGQFGAGRVLQLNTPRIPSKTKAFFGGLHDWVGDERPTADDIQARPLLDYGVMHIWAITKIGGEIQGLLDLDDDRLSIPFTRSAVAPIGSTLLRGTIDLREATRDEADLYPPLRFWGYNYIGELANDKLVGMPNYT